MRRLRPRLPLWLLLWLFAPTSTGAVAETEDVRLATAGPSQLRGIAGGRRLDNASTSSPQAVDSGNTDSGDDTVLIVAISCTSGGVLLLIGVVAGACMFLSSQKAEVDRQFRKVRELDELEEDFETRQDRLKNHVEVYTTKFELWSGATGYPLDRHTSFIDGWNRFLEESRSFIEADYTPALHQRRASVEKSARFGSEGMSREVSGGKMSVRKVNSQDARPGGLMPRPKPATPPAEVVRQLNVLRSLDGRLDAMVQDFQALQEELFPAGNAVAELPLMNSWGNNQPRDPRLEEEAEILQTLMHPLLARVSVKRYGVLGLMVGEKDPRPGSAIDAVVVDPAGWPFIGRANNPKGAGGASGSIYQWLGISRGAEARFPQPVHQHFGAPCEAEAETRAKFHMYDTGQYVIHAVGPKVEKVLEGVTDLSHTYLNVLSEFCHVTSAMGSKVPRTLRLPPISSGIFLQNKRLDRHMAQVTSSALALAFAMLPLQMHEQLRASKLELCVFNKRDQQVYEDVFAAKSSAVGAGPLRLDQDMGRVPTRLGGYDWVRQKNGPMDRLERLGAMLLTQRATCGGGYVPPGKGGPVALNLEGMIQGTRVLHAPPKLMARVSPNTKRTNVVWEETATVMEAAIKAGRNHQRVVAVNAASAYHVGGGVLTGGRHALEETWCTISTLLHSLQEVQWKRVLLHQAADELPHGSRTAVGGAAHGGWGEAQLAGAYSMHVPVDGCIVSPDVVIFRDTSAKGYAFQAEGTRLAGVCSVAMFNMNPRVSDSPVDAPHDFEEYCRQVRQKFRAVVAGAVELKAEVLVCPDVGCGVFENDPHVLGTMLGEVLRELPGAVSEVVLTGKAAFAMAAKKAEAGEAREPLKAPRFFGNVLPQPNPELNLAGPTGAPGHGAAAYDQVPVSAGLPGSSPVALAEAPGDNVGSASAGTGQAKSPAAAPTKSGTAACAACCTTSAAAQAQEPRPPKVKQPKAQAKAAAGIPASSAPAPAAAPKASATPPTSSMPASATAPRAAAAPPTTSTTASTAPPNAATMPAAPARALSAPRATGR